MQCKYLQFISLSLSQPNKEAQRQMVVEAIAKFQQQEDRSAMAMLSNSQWGEDFFFSIIFMFHDFTTRF
jgi:hypothetical protein